MVEDPMASAPIIVEKFGRAYRVHSDDETTDSAKFVLIIKGMSAGSRLWTKHSYDAKALPEVLKAR